MTQHTLLYIHKPRGFCKAVKEPENTPEPEQHPKPKITAEIVNDQIKQNPDTASTYLRNERSMKAQKKQMHVRSLLNNACLIILFHFITYNTRCRIRRSKQFLVLFSLIY